MIQYVDDQIAYCLNTILKAPIDKIYWGNLTSVRRYVAGKNRSLKLPYFAFYRRILPHDDRKSYEIPIEGPNGFILAKYINTKVQYTVECMLDNVEDQNDIIRNFLIWGGECPSITVDQYLNTEIDLHAVFEDPEDNTDLEAEYDLGRLVRETLTITVTLPLIQHTFEVPTKIFKVLRGIHNYNGKEVETLEDRGLYIEELRVTATNLKRLIVVLSEELSPEFLPESLSLSINSIKVDPVWSIDSNGILADLLDDLVASDIVEFTYDDTLSVKIKSLNDLIELPDQYVKYEVEITTG